MRFISFAGSALASAVLLESDPAAAFFPGAIASFSRGLSESACLSESQFLADDVSAGRQSIRKSCCCSVLRMCERGASDGSAELIGALARLDRKWELQRKDKPYGEWQKLVVGELPAKEPSSSPSLEDFFAAAATKADGRPREQFVYLLEPEPPATPSCILLFLGGATLGQYPHVAYSEMLKRVARRLNAAVIAAPYELGMNHFDLSKESCEAMRRAIIALEDDKGYRPSMPKFLLAHSLGGKLGTISLAATGIGDELQGVGLMSWCNFGVKDIVRLSRSFAKELGFTRSFGSTSPGREPILDGILDFAEMAVGIAGVEFSPSPADTERIVDMKYDASLQEKTRLFVFDDDELDCSRSFVTICKQSGGNGPSVSSLPGTHLTPVYLKLGVDELDLPEDARYIADEFTGGFRGASFGDENNLNTAVDEICGWVLGKPPSREPNWESENADKDDDVWRGPRRLSGGAVEAEVET